MDVCTLLVNSEFSKPQIQFEIFCKILDLFVYQTGQFPHFHLLQTCQKQSSICENLQTKKECQYLKMIHELKSQLMYNACGGCLFLIMLGGLPYKPDRAVLVDFVQVEDSSDDDVKQSSDQVFLFTDLFSLLVQNESFAKVFQESKPTRMFVYMCRSKNFQCSWFLPRVNFRLPKSCSLFVIKFKLDSKNFGITMECQDSAIDLNYLTDIVYNNDICCSGLIWYACPTVFQGVT